MYHHHLDEQQSRKHPITSQWSSLVVRNAPFPVAATSSTSATALKQQRLSLASQASPRVVQPWNFRDEMDLAHAQTADASSSASERSSFSASFQKKLTFDHRCMVLETGKRSYELPVSCHHVFIYCPRLLEYTIVRWWISGHYNIYHCHWSVGFLFSSLVCSYRFSKVSSLLHNTTRSAMYQAGHGGSAVVRLITPFHLGKDISTGDAVEERRQEGSRFIQKEWLEGDLAQPPTPPKNRKHIGKKWVCFWV
jgi:hypothetical protein